MLWAILSILVVRSGGGGESQPSHTTRLIRLHSGCSQLDFPGEEVFGRTVSHIVLQAQATGVRALCTICRNGEWIFSSYKCFLAASDPCDCMPSGTHVSGSVCNSKGDYLENIVHRQKMIIYTLGQSNHTPHYSSIESLSAYVRIITQST